jgi:uncharacterized protein YwqG
MLIETITFEIRNFNNGTAEQYVVTNSQVNFELISAHRFTREISFTKMFSFEFIAKANYPKFIEFGEAVAMAFVENYDVAEIDDVDEMVGTY